MNSLPKYSCQGCTKREVGCHAKCEEYKMQKAEYERRKAEARVWEDYKRDKSDSYFEKDARQKMRQRISNRCHKTKSE